jgi:hypothetical protein
VKAFPNSTNQQGMDLRDYFAAKVMQSFLTNRTILETVNENEVLETIAGGAYQIADAMMEARKKTP